MAASARQIAANRANAKKGAGPRSAAGKLKSSKNALIHGLLSSDMLVADEDSTQYDALLDSLVSDLVPAGANAHMLVEKIAIALWKMKRLNGAEAATIKRRQMSVTALSPSKTDAEKVGLRTELRTYALPANSLSFIRYQAQLECQYYRAMTMRQGLHDRRELRTVIDL